MLNRKNGLIVLIFEVLFVFVYIWLTRIPLSLMDASTAFGLIFIVSIMSITVLFITIPKRVNVLEYFVNRYSKMIVFTLGITVLIYVGYFLSGSVLFRSNAYYNLIGNVEERKFATDIEPFDFNQIPYVDTTLAARLGDKLMGNDTAMGSQFEVGAFTRQSVDGKLSMVAPLNHKSFFSWLSNLEGTPGYIIISATNPQDIKLVKAVGGKPIKIKYGTSSFLNQELIRYIRMKGNLTDLLTDYSFEVDDAGTPYWVVTKYKNRIGWSGSDATGAIIVNAVSGDIKEYSLNNLPAWVDRVQPKDFFQEQLTDRGQYVHGIFNFSDRDKLKPTGEVQLVYNKGQCYFYEGLTSIGKDNSTVGFILSDTRTKKTYFYKMSGCFEDSAKRSAQGKVQNFGYIAYSPIIVNIEGIPSFFMTLRDTEGLVKNYALVNIQSYQIVGVGETIQECKNDYMKANLTAGGTLNPDVPSVKKEITGTVSRISWNIVSGNSVYYILLEDNPQRIYTIIGSISEKLPLTNVKDNVKIVYNEQGSGKINVLEFDNLSMK